jgi:hypothetical protein
MDLNFMKEKIGAEVVRVELYTALMFRGGHAYQPTSLS